MYCDSNIEWYIRKKDFEYLNGLTPLKRFSEKFRLETEALELDVKENDAIIGWFRFDKSCSDRTVFPDEELTREETAVIHAPERFSSRIDVGTGHTLVDYESILKYGLVFYEKRIDEELKNHPGDEYLSAMKDTLSCVRGFTDRIARVITEKAAVGSEAEKQRLPAMKAMIEKVPYGPAETFREAVQSVWIIHFLLPLAENGWYSISLGKFDQYMYPYYRQSLMDGMTREEAKKILYNLYELLNSYADGACLLNVGPAYNALSELIIECQKEFSMPAPILGARVDKNTPDHIWESLIDEKLFSMGQPTFYGEQSCRNALAEKGVSAEEADGFSNNSCMGIGIPGKEFDSMWGCVFSVSSALEAAMNGGKTLYSDAVSVPGVKIPHTIDELFDNFTKCAEYLLGICVRAYEKGADVNEKRYPDPLVSILTEDCIKLHRDRIFGARYRNVTVECMGMINVSDGICAVDQLVFRQKKYTVNEMNDAVRNNFAGYEKLRKDIMTCSKFGENAEADSYAVRTAQILQRLIRSFNHDHLYYSPSLHTLDTNVGYGAGYGAGYDGRYAGAPFAKNAGASNEARRPDPTSVILSSSKLPQHQFFGGQPIDIHFGTDTVRNHKKEIRSLITVYLERGGLQFQVNSASAKLLRDAMENPANYPDLVVRIGGYSVSFHKLSKKSQLEFIERFEREEG